MNIAVAPPSAAILHVIDRWHDFMRGDRPDALDDLRVDDTGKIVEFRVMVRPVQALNAVHALMGAQLATLDPKSRAAS